MRLNQFSTANPSSFLQELCDEECSKKIEQLEVVTLPSGLKVSALVGLLILYGACLATLGCWSAFAVMGMWDLMSTYACPHRTQSPTFEHPIGNPPNILLIPFPIRKPPTGQL